MTHEHITVFDDDEAVDITVTVDGTLSEFEDLVFLHGWGLSPRSYQGVSDAIATHGYRVWSPALPGFGKSDPLPVTIHDAYQRTADRMAHAIEALNLPAQVPIVGHSFGAGLAVSIAHRSPAAVSRLVLISPIGSAGASLTTWIRLVAGLRHEVRHNTASRAADAIPSFLRNPIALAASGIAAKHADLLDTYRTTAQAGIPITVIAADHDEVIPLGRIPQTPGVEIVAVHGSHGWLLAEPAECGMLVHQALSKDRSSDAKSV